MKFSFIITIALFITSCQPDKVINKNTNSFTKTHTLKMTGELSLNLDDNTSPISLCIQPILTDSIQMLAVINKYTNAIIFFDINTKNSVKMYLFDKEGQNGVGSIDGFMFLNEDSIFVYSRSINQLSLVNNKSQLIKRYAIFDDKKVSKDFSPPSPNIMTLTPIRKIDHYLIIHGYLIGEIPNETFENRPTCIILNLHNGDIQYAHGYPDFYHKNNWGGSPTYRTGGQEVQNDKIIASFPASHDIQVYSFKNKKYTYHYAGSEKIKDITPFSKSKIIPLDDNKVFDWYMNNPSYEGIFFDKFNQVYYRIARLPLIEKFDPYSQYNKKPVIIIILDPEFNYIGEKELPHKFIYSPYNIFINENGLHIQIKTDNDEKMTFLNFKLERL